MLSLEEQNFNDIAIEQKLENANAFEVNESEFWHPRSLVDND